MKRLLSLSIVVLLLMAVSAPSAFAGWFWCEDDPMVRIATPGGNAVNVHVTNYGLTDGDAKPIRKALKQAEISYTAQSSDGGTAVTITVLIPSASNSFKTRSVVSTLPKAKGVVYATAEGKSGKPMKLQFTLDVP